MGADVELFYDDNLNGGSLGLSLAADGVMGSVELAGGTKGIGFTNAVGVGTIIGAGANTELFVGIEWGVEFRWGSVIPVTEFNIIALSSIGGPIHGEFELKATMSIWDLIDSWLNPPDVVIPPNTERGPSDDPSRPGNIPRSTSAEDLAGTGYVGPDPGNSVSLPDLYDPKALRRQVPGRGTSGSMIWGPRALAATRVMGKMIESRQAMPNACL